MFLKCLQAGCGWTESRGLTESCINVGFNTSLWIFQHSTHNSLKRRTDLECVVVDVAAAALQVL